MCTATAMLLAGLALATGPGPRVIAHDLERTRVVVTFASDGTFQVDVVNNPDWLLERLDPFSGQPLSGRLDPGPRDRRLAELEETFARWVWVYFGDERLELAAEYIPPPRGPIDPNRPPWRIALVFAFGLLHGMGFAGVLSDLGLPRSERLTGLVSFNLGVEGGQLAVIALAFGAIGWLRHKEWYRRRTVWPLSLFIAAVGLYWTVTRVAGV
ncbi:MAG: HupE/UreJ family protein [Gemmatimonadetes bacterium]|nr:HupE/UreJ family protein [Gemmatimonadota bacterium]